MPDTLTITDNRTGKSYEVPIRYGTYPNYGAYIDGTELRKIKSSDDDFGLLSYDPAYMNTPSTRSAITFIDGDKGILRYRRSPIEQPAGQSRCLVTASLSLHAHLQSPQELEEWTHEITMPTLIHENMRKFMEGFHYGAHPMGMLVSTVAALST